MVKPVMIGQFLKSSRAVLQALTKRMGSTHGCHRGAYIQTLLRDYLNFFVVVMITRY